MSRAIAVKVSTAAACSCGGAGGACGAYGIGKDRGLVASLKGLEYGGCVFTAQELDHLALVEDVNLSVGAGAIVVIMGLSHDSMGPRAGPSRPLRPAHLSRFAVTCGCSFDL